MSNFKKYNLQDAVTLYEYKTVSNNDIYYGYPFGEALEKVVDGEIYIEVTDSLEKPKKCWIKKDGIKFSKKVSYVPN